MSWSRALLTVGLCFGLGLGFAPTLRLAHACSCLDVPYWDLGLESIIGDGDLGVEEAFWLEEALLMELHTLTLYVVDQDTGFTLELERVQ